MLVPSPILKNYLTGFPGIDISIQIYIDTDIHIYIYLPFLSKYSDIPFLKFNGKGKFYLEIY